MRCGIEQLLDVFSDRPVLVLFVLIVVGSRIWRGITGSRGGTRQPGGRDRDHAADAPPPPPSVLATTPPLGLHVDELMAFTSLGSPAGTITDSTEVRRALPAAGDAMVDVGAFVWHFAVRDNGRWKQTELPVAVVRAPDGVDMPGLVLRRPGTRPPWHMLTRNRDLERVGRVWDVSTVPPQLLDTAFSTDFITFMAETAAAHPDPELTFEAAGRLLLVLPTDPRTAPTPGRRQHTTRLSPDATSTAEELPALVDHALAVANAMGTHWWEAVGLHGQARADDDLGAAPVDDPQSPDDETVRQWAQAWSSDGDPAPPPAPSPQPVQPPPPGHDTET